MKGIQSQLEGHAKLIEEAENAAIDEYNALVDEAEKLGLQVDRVQEQNTNLIKQRDTLVEKRAEDAKDVKQIVEVSRKLKNTNENLCSDNARLTRELKELRALNPKKQKEQITRLKNKQKEWETKVRSWQAKYEDAKKRVLWAEGEYTAVADKYNDAVEMMRDMKAMLYQEGAICEKSIQGEDTNFYIYRRPTTKSTDFIVHDDENENEKKPFYFRIETDTGIHFDLICLKSGEVGFPKTNVFEVPDEVGEYCRDEYLKADGEFLPNRWESKSDQMEEIEDLFARFEARANETPT